MYVETTMTGRSIIVAKTSKKLAIAIAAFLWLTLGCFAAGLAGNVWIVITKVISPGKTAQVTYGLWKNCSKILDQPQECSVRKFSELLSFDNVSGTDPIIICLLISAGFIILTLIVTSSMFCCCRRKPRLWRRSIKWNVVFLIIAVTAAVDAMLYVELSYFQSYRDSMIGEGWYNGRGWCYMLSWAGAGFVCLAFILTLSQLCTKHEDVDMNCR